ncbi:hypothetical protein [Synechococcus sp. EJ6-Ellesmere]|uniref:hypothetical protein n=1 Tax=Synechococcus sp. EJ6-Ellesmere TaxID=2823734 RepID=UPI0020CBD998|nr:hypothetical protein [Synechococcus sp. EJ6-Ellesmere]MCP9824502.1 hypothetical protein [Synechococcus sp. EJ6-Ellesmere]
MRRPLILTGPQRSTRRWLARRWDELACTAERLALAAELAELRQQRRRTWGELS